MYCTDVTTNSTSFFYLRIAEHFEAELGVLAHQVNGEGVVVLAPVHEIQEENIL